MKTLTVALFVASLAGLLFESSRLLGIACIALLLAFDPVAALVLLPLARALFYFIRFL